MREAGAWTEISTRGAGDACEPCEGDQSDGACVCWGVVWFLLLWFIGWPIAGFCAGFYILLLPLTVCIEGLKVSFHEFVSN